MRGDSDIQAITATPAITAVTAAECVALFEKNPNKNSPSMPPLKMEAKAHQASRILATCTSDNAMIVPPRPTPIVERYKVLMPVFSLVPIHLKRTKKSVSRIVAELLRLVETVLMPAANMDAIKSPVTPTGNPLTINQGNTLSACPGSVKEAGSSSGCTV